MRILFLGTPEFAVPSLAVLIENGYEVVGVITAPDKPAGRGQKLQLSAVKAYSLEKGLKIFQPLRLKDPDFLSDIKTLNADLGIVVAFRMMPEVLFTMPRMGTINLHGALLPQYRGAAPIQRAVMNGEKITGVTTFFLNNDIDTGKIIFRDEMEIYPEETGGQLHDRMMAKGAELVLKTVQSIESGNYSLTAQEDFITPGESLKSAPKIFKADCKLNFSNAAEELLNLVRGLSPYPAAFINLKNTSSGELATVKIYLATYEKSTLSIPGKFFTDHQSFLKIGAVDGWLNILEIQWPGKKRLKIMEFLRGFKWDDQWTLME